MKIRNLRFHPKSNLNNFEKKRMTFRRSWPSRSKNERAACAAALRKMSQGQRQHGQNPKELYEIEQLWRILGVLRPLYFLAPHTPTGRALGTFMLGLVRQLTVLTECVFDPSDPVDHTIEQNKKAHIKKETQREERAEDKFGRSAATASCCC